jgi:hypothetical protein
LGEIDIAAIFGIKNRPIGMNHILIKNLEKIQRKEMLGENVK